MTHPWCRVASILVACSLCSSVMAQDTYTQGASTERRAPAETIPVDDQQAGRDVSPRDEATDAKSAAQIPAKAIAAAVENELYHDVVLSLDDARDHKLRLIRADLAADLTRHKSASRSVATER